METENTPESASPQSGTPDNALELLGLGSFAGSTPSGALEQAHADNVEDGAPEDPIVSEEKRLEEYRQRLEKHWGVADKKERKVKKQLMRLKQERDSFAQQKKVFDETIGRLTRGDARQILDALGQVTGRSGNEVYEMLSRGLLEDRQAETATESPLKKELEEIKSLKEELLNNKKRLEQREAEQARKDGHNIILELGKDAENYPRVASVIGKHPEKVIKEIENIFYQAKSRYDVVPTFEEAMDYLESEYTELGVTPTLSRDAGLETSADTTANPGKTRRPSGQTIDSQASGSRGSALPNPKELSPDEAMRVAIERGIVDMLGIPL